MQIVGFPMLGSRRRLTADFKIRHSVFILEDFSSSPSAYSRPASVSYCPKDVHKVLVNASRNLFGSNIGISS